MGKNSYSRREFLQVGAALAAAAGLPAYYARLLAVGAQRLSEGLLRVLWLQGQACSGCSISLLNADNPPALQAITQQLELVFHPTLSAAQGTLVLQLLEQVQSEARPLVLVLEGAIPARMPEACTIAGRRFDEILLGFLRRAQFVVAAGTCASYGGLPAAEGNATGAVGLREFMERAGLQVADRLVNCPGCPCHPAELLGTLAHLAAKGYPHVRAASLTPSMFAISCLHDECLRVSSYTLRVFAMHFGDGDGCLYQLGCRGLDVYADCARRRWNGGVNWCVQASAPCIGCTLPDFGRSKAAPFYRKGQKLS